MSYRRLIFLICYINSKNTLRNYNQIYLLVSNSLMFDKTKIHIINILKIKEFLIVI